MKERMTLAVLIPAVAMLVIATYAGGLGVIFMLLNETGAEEWAVVILGLALVIGVPSAVALLQRMIEKT